MRTRRSLSVVVPAALAALALTPASAAADVDADVQPQGGGVTGRAGAGVAYGGVHESFTVAPGARTTRTCAGALLAGTCTTTGDGTSGFVQADLLLYGGSVTYTAGGSGAVVCSTVVYGVCTP